jgi:CheY-like chemotaxis protein
MTTATAHLTTACRDVAVMVVEDHDDSRDMLVFALEALGAHVVGVSSAVEALTYMQRVRPDVLVSDLSMPEMDGFELLQHVRASPGLEDLPAIAVTGHGEMSAKARQSGFQRFFRKPIDTIELCRAIGALTGGRPHSQ